LRDLFYNTAFLSNPIQIIVIQPMTCGLAPANLRNTDIPPAEPSSAPAARRLNRIATGSRSAHPQKLAPCLAHACFKTMIIRDNIGSIPDKRLDNAIFPRAIH